MSDAANRRLSDVDDRLLALAEHGYTFVQSVFWLFACDQPERR